MNVTIRADASPAIGSGHVMRCLCLADALRGAGCSVRFICRSLPRHLRDLIRQHGHVLVELPPLDDLPARPESPWPDALQQQDARETAALLPGDAARSWLIVDHYGLGLAWEASLRIDSRHVLVVDDLGRAHDCDLLLDQNLYADPEARYAGRLPAQAQHLLGPSYALLRPEFLAARAHAQAREGAVRKLLVFLGGMDAANATSAVLRVVERIRPPDLEVDVVIGASHPARQAIESRAARSTWLRCHVQTSDMAALCAAADLAIGAGGSATWERCAVGLPTLALCLAENQRQLLREGACHGLLYAIEEASPSSSTLLRHIWALLTNTGLRNHLSRTGLATVDAQGTARVVAHLLAAGVVVRAACEEDASQLRAWRNQSRVRAASRQTQEISRKDHAQWLRQVLASPDRHLLIGEVEGQPIGAIRYDIEGDRAEVSIYLAPSDQARGQGLALLQSAQHWLQTQCPGIHQLDAEVLGDNAPSHRLFAQAGYQRVSTRYLQRI
ncbi:UDP-2,4-diacetamido-2,4,6-trideoxy-beta-L-altropyranose hydrolase [Polaromonas sp.]|uniref:UDP-2,4-diacetamido-2,4, 6-trideoxy-beta-L-altropyranose hydrolase n=1 Tax=Polaromonas sp. TaxID=1869339 RepID=UPI003BAA07C7